ncbi:3-oxoacyl-ACP reductase FabG [Candidatus Uabimicrobium amorphum]|uniref:3-ketoacyl-ACP reductase n=1 Tax=Uabimicrobium amorphum TaxID=2596890 RepID=A0A5S9IRD2_UABAM|nr:3-oxoacyl-ACP reductase FabG [Candidatus Uabimicrobium amorphum]BBM86718.1 3-ketoacyl-ACP reductase [Candidatus Uabimicrobium amorphum]
MEEKKNALITGGSKGIGRAISIELAMSGYHVMVNYHSDDDAANTTKEMIEEKGGSATLLKFNVANHDEVQQHLLPIFEEQKQGIEVLVNNAGIIRDNSIVWMSKDNWDDVIRTNLDAFFYVSKIVSKRMVKQKYGRIISIASTSGQAGMRGQVNYSASKGGIIAATKSLAIELASRKITANVVAPGFIDTEMVQHVDQEKVLPHIPMKRIGTPEEVAAVVGFLASAKSSYITGQVIAVNGGMYM